jgi:zinc protease
MADARAGTAPEAETADGSGASNGEAVDRSIVVPTHYTAQKDIGKAVTVAKLSNGLTVIVQENHAAPVATARCYVNQTGGAYEGEYLGAGISHLIEHLVAGGSTENRTEKEITAIIDTLGGRTNAYTSDSITAYFIDAPADRIGTAIEIISDQMQHAAFVPEEYRRELGVVQRELEMGETERSRVGYQAMKGLIFQEHPTRHPTIGYLPVLQKITRQDVVDFYRDRYVPQNMVFVVVGDVKTDEVLDMVLKNFADFERTTERRVVLGDEPDQISPRSTRVEMPGETVEWSVAWPTVMLQHPDLYPLDVASNLLTTGNSSRLVKRLRVQEPLAVGISSASYTPSYVKGWFELSVECPAENLAACRDGIFAEIERLKTELVSDAELAKVKRQKAAEHVFGQQTIQAQAESLARSYLSTGDPLYDEHYVAGIQGVTPEQIRDVARRYFTPERMNTVELVPPGTELPESAEDATDVESDIVRRVLPNGLTLLVKRQAAVPLVSVQAFVRAGSLAETNDKAGLASLTSTLMRKGTEKYSEEQISEYFDSVGGGLAVTSERNTSYLQAAVLSDDFDTALDYVDQVLFHPTFPEAEFVKAQRLQGQKIAARTADMRTEIFDYFTSKLPRESPFSRPILGLQDTVSGLTLDEVRAFHKQYFVPNNMVIAVFGDLEVEPTLERLERLFGDAPKDESFSFPEFATLPEAIAAQGTEARDQVEELVNNHPNSAMVMLAYPAPSIRDTDRSAQLRMLNAVLTNGFGTRLFDELRGDQLVYYVFGQELRGLAPGYFFFMAQTRPETTGEVVNRVKANLQRVREEGIPIEEFERAREKLLAAHAMSNTTAQQQAFQAAVFELYGLGYDYDKSFPDRIKAVQPQDVQKLVEEFFGPAIVVTTRPADES